MIYQNECFSSSLRVLLDRASSDLDGVLKQLDSAVFSSSFPKGLSAVPELSDHQVPSQNHRTMPGSASSLTDLLSNIQALRWRFFRPRSTQGDGSGEGRTGRPSMDNRLSGGLFVHTKNSGSGELLLNTIVKVHLPLFKPLPNII